ncbi:MAG: hypothetical protein EB015_17175, partial [Methylocystaceae bacterium]|nr:hypothetical protein [Methylocystaceae bacterium]
MKLIYLAPSRVAAPLRIFMFFMAFAFASRARAELLWLESGGQVTITGRTDSASALVIPAAINGLPVTGIGSKAFAKGQGLGLTSVTIPSTVTSIPSSTFASCSELTGISVDPQNASYSSLGGVLFNKAQTTLVS